MPRDLPPTRRRRPIATINPPDRSYVYARRLPGRGEGAQALQDILDAVRRGPDRLRQGPAVNPVTGGTRAPVPRRVPKPMIEIGQPEREGPRIAVGRAQLREGPAGGLPAGMPGSVPRRILPVNTEAANRAAAANRAGRQVGRMQSAAIDQALRRRRRLP